MTTHLSSQEFVDALGEKDGVLPAARQSHLEGCASCQSQLAQLRALIDDASDGADVPEPSPLFWDHFQARVLTAVQGVEQPGRRAWWMNWVDVRTMVALGAVVVAVVASAALYVSRPAPPAPAALTDSGTDGGQVIGSGALTDASGSLDNDEWEFVTSVMSDLDGDDIHEVLAPSRDAVDAAIEGLTVAERDRFVRLLKGELEGSE
jgi:hypothetical protein